MIVGGLIRPAKMVPYLLTGTVLFALVHTLAYCQPQNPKITTLSPLEPRTKDIIERMQALDADIGKLLFNSTSMYSPNDSSDTFKENNKGGERFTEVLLDIDNLQDQIGGMIQNATRHRQYNILVRLRPVNNLLYRIRHNLHLMRNSLVAINAVSSLEKLGNTVLDSTLQAFLRPDAEMNGDFEDAGVYDINLDKPEQAINQIGPNGSQPSDLFAPISPPPTTAAAPVTTPTTTTTTTTTTPATTVTEEQTTTTEKPTTTTTTTTTTKRPTIRPTNRRNNGRPNQRRNTSRQTSTTTTTTTIRPFEEVL